MGKYGFYIVPCYVGLLSVCGWHLYSAYKQYKEMRRKLKQTQPEIFSDAQQEA